MITPADTSTGRKQIGRCGKVCFDKRGAQTKKNSLERFGRARELRIYHCPTCNAWHLTKLFRNYYKNHRK